jgi:hypothetical protein
MAEDPAAPPVAAAGAGAAAGSDLLGATAALGTRTAGVGVDRSGTSHEQENAECGT